MIESTEQTLKKIFKGDHAKITAMTYRNLRRITDTAFIYGEIDFLSFHRILEKTAPLPNDIFYDLGSGAGKAVFTAALFFDLSKSYGIELVPPLYEKANQHLKKANQLEKKYLKKIAAIEFINDSFLTYDFCNANIIYVAATCLSDTTWDSLIHKMAHLNPGSRIIVATKNIEHQRFEMIHQSIELMSWGLCPITIYKIKKFD